MNIFEIRQTPDSQKIFYKYPQDEKSILFAFAAPILFSALRGLNKEKITDFGGYDKILLRQLAYLYKENSGSRGKSFEYAVHEAIKRNDPMIIGHIKKALEFCGVEGNDTISIHLGFEKAGGAQIIDTAKTVLTENSLLMTSPFGEKIKIFFEIDKIANSFRNRKTRLVLPIFYSEIWKADLLIGNKDIDLWVGASVKVNYKDVFLPSFFPRGLCIAIYPCRMKSESVNYIENKNMVTCPLPYYGGFMRYFDATWMYVNEFLKKEANIPNKNLIFSQDAYDFLNYLKFKRNESVIKVCDDLQNASGVEIFENDYKKGIITHEIESSTTKTSEIIAPIPLIY